MAGNLWTWGIDNFGQPLLDAWWTPGWNAQNKDYIQVPPSQFAPQGFPQDLNYVTVIGNYFDTSSDPLSGYLTFWPSSALTYQSGSAYTYIPQRYSGINQTLLGLNQMGDGKIYLWYGQLNVTLLATDNSFMTPASFTYHVKEHYLGGQQYDITVPSADVSSYPDIHSLIIPGSVFPVNDEIEEFVRNFLRIPAVSTQYVVADVTTAAGGMSFSPTSFPVNFAFISGPSEPQESDWVPGGWASEIQPYVAQVLVGPYNGGLVLSPGSYQVWVQVVSPVQVPVMQVGTLEIY
jgi:hypothetical protein